MDGRLIGFEEARSRILERARPLPKAGVPLECASGLVLAEDIAAPIAIPPFDNSAMDGFALSSSCAASKLKVSQAIMAGDAPRPLEPGTCAKIMTGAPLPEGADSVVPIEEAEELMGWATLRVPVRRGQHVRIAGEDLKRGETAAASGTLITPRHIALFAALGLDRIAVLPRPRVAVIVTGSELAPLGKPLDPGKIYDSNGIALRAALSELSISPQIFRAADDVGDLRAAVEEALRASDVLLTVGGVSVGDRDHVKEVFEALGASLEFWRVAMKPGKPVALWTIGQKLAFGLPGNPVSCLLTYDQLVRPAILKMMGRGPLRPRIKAAAAEKMKGSPDKTDFLRGIARDGGGRMEVRPSGPQGSAMLKSLADSNCIIILPEGISRVAEGDAVEIELYEAC